MKIYIASSWKNAQIAIDLARYLRSEDYEVDCFADESTSRFVFHFSEIGDKESLDAKTFLQDERSQRAFYEDKKWLDWCECCILILPAGRSSHLEAGYIKGQGKKLVIWSSVPFPKGEFDVMYGFADLLTDQIIEVVDWLKPGLQCEACGKKKALTTPVDGIDLGKRFVCHCCITLPSDTLARMIRKRGEGHA